jgi:hypothetical protein
MKSICFITSVSVHVSLFRFCFQDMSIGESGVLKSSTIIVWGAMCALSSSNVCFIIWVPLNLVHRCSGLRVYLGRFYLWSL